MKTLNYQIPWQEINATTGALENQLQKELNANHILFGKPVTAIATRQDCDEVLFKITENEFAVVHLTWSQQKVNDNNYPSTTLIISLEAVQAKLDDDFKDYMEFENSPENEIGGLIKGKKKIIIVGASSGIGNELAKKLALEGNLVGITGRRNELLENLRKSFSGRIITSCFDVTKNENAIQLEKLVTRLNGLDILIICAGTGEPVPELNWSIDKMTIDTNVQGFTEIANWGFNYFTKQGHGHLVNISSIAAIRGGSHAPAYNASKAFQSNYFEGLAIKASKMNGQIAVTSIEPGFVDTRMAKGDGIFWLIPVSKAADQILVAIHKRKRKVFISRRWWLIAKLMKWAPYWIYRKLG
ncbi:MAG: SDR family NAD(P)-dependent oxidoreductase [Chitinophagaceae bacterium]